MRGGIYIPQGREHIGFSPKPNRSDQRKYIHTFDKKKKSSKNETNLRFQIDAEDLPLAS